MFILTLPEDTIFMAAGLKDAAGLGFMVMVLQVLMTAVSIPLMELWHRWKKNDGFYKMGENRLTQPMANL